MYDGKSEKFPAGTVEIGEVERDQNTRDFRAHTRAFIETIHIFRWVGMGVYV